MSRSFIRTIIPVFALLLGSGLMKLSSAEQPNFIIILVDDLRWDELGCTGHPFAATPNIDRIANEGALFRNAFCTTPLCSPGRANLLTGLYTHNHGILDNTQRNEQSHKLNTFPRILHETGKYETAYVGKWHMGNDGSARPGYDYWVSMKGQGTSFDPVLIENGKETHNTGHTTDVLNTKAVDFLKLKHDKPFCLYIAHKALHPELVQRDDGSISDPGAAQFLPAKRHEKLYANVGIPRRLNVLDDLQGKPALQRTIKGLPPLSRKTGTSDKTILDRQRMLVAVDEGVGMLFRVLKENKQLDDTVIILTSDHGYWYGEHGLSVERRLAYEEGLRIPMMIRYPSLTEGAGIIDQMVLSIDLAPTVLDLANVDESLASKMDGRSLLPLFQAHAPTDWRKSFLIEYNTDTVFPRVHKMGYRAIRTDRWKLIHYLDMEGMDELYDLKNDPYEMKNIITDQQAQTDIKELRAELEKLQNNK
ncbi:MAG: sulfatase [Verrucomicrobiota bacterium]